MAATELANSYINSAWAFCKRTKKVLAVVVKPFEKGDRTASSEPEQSKKELGLSVYVKHAERLLVG